MLSTPPAEDVAGSVNRVRTTPRASAVVPLLVPDVEEAIASNPTVADPSGFILMDVTIGTTDVVCKPAPLIVALACASRAAAMVSATGADTDVLVSAPAASMRAIKLPVGACGGM
jgi:hypothetical protein